MLAHARTLLAGSDEGATEYIDSDLRDTLKILARASQLLNLTKPVAVTLLTVLHAIPDGDDPYAIVAFFSCGGGGAAGVPRPAGGRVPVVARARAIRTGDVVMFCKPVPSPRR